MGANMKAVWGAVFGVLLTAPAIAADLRMPVKAAPAPAVVPFSWTGFYIGAHVGAAHFQKDWFVPLSANNFPGICPGCPAAIGGHNDTSWLAGGQAGFNYQVGAWVWGVEAQFSATNLKGSHANPLFAGNLDASETKWLGTVAGRLGMAWDRTLIYGKGGVAWAHDRFSVSTTTTFEAQATDNTRIGWMAGGGIEYAWSANWSMKVEYNYMDFGEKRETLRPTANCPACAAFDYDIDQRIHVVKFGINYRFGGLAPVTARY